MYVCVCIYTHTHSLTLSHTLYFVIYLEDINNLYSIYSWVLLNLAGCFIFIRRYVRYSLLFDIVQLTNSYFQSIFETLYRYDILCMLFINWCFNKAICTLFLFFYSSVANSGAIMDGPLSLLNKVFITIYKTVIELNAHEARLFWYGWKDHSTSEEQWR